MNKDQYESLKLMKLDLQIAERSRQKVEEKIRLLNMQISPLLEDCDHVYPDGRRAAVGGFPHQFRYCEICGLDEEYDSLYPEVMVALSPETVTSVDNAVQNIYQHYIFRFRHEIESGKPVKIAVFGTKGDYVTKEESYKRDNLRPIHDALEKATGLCDPKCKLSEVKQDEKAITLVYRYQ